MGVHKDGADNILYAEIWKIYLVISVDQKIADLDIFCKQCCGQSQKHSEKNALVIRFFMS